MRRVTVTSVSTFVCMAVSTFVSMSGVVLLLWLAADCAPAPPRPVAASHDGGHPPATIQEKPAPPVAPTVGGEGPDPDGTLVGEERERDSRSEKVTIKIVADPRRKAHVVWGSKDLGEAPLQIERPRNSGPLDVIIRAPGYLTLHTRALTDRDDTLFLRLYAEEEGPQLLGYRAGQSAEAKDGQNSPQNRAKKSPPNLKQEAIPKK
jgi:hypothetical protein